MSLELIFPQLGYHAAITSMSYGRMADMLAVCCNIEVSKTRGPDMIWSATLLQPSGAKCRVSIFRPRKESFPSASDGSVLLLRNFRILSSVRELCLQSQDDSAWAAFSCSEGVLEPTITTPAAPVEYSDKEVQHAKSLLSWWSFKGHKMAPTITSARPKLTLNAFHVNAFFDIEAEVVRIPRFMTSPFIIIVTDYSKSLLVSDESRENASMSSLDTLESIGVSDDTSDSLILGIELRSQDAKYALEKVRVGQKVLLQNVTGRRGLDGGLYGIIEPAISGKPSISLLP